MHQNVFQEKLPMRTTLDIADDVLFAAKSIARQEKKSIGQVITELARHSFANAYRYPTAARADAAPAALHVSARLATYGITPLSARGGIVSNELIDRLRDAEGI